MVCCRLLVAKALSRDLTNLISTIFSVQVFETIDEDSDKNIAPRLVTYFKGDEVSTAYVIAGKNISYELTETPSLVKCLTLLMATYYAFDIDFPPQYDSFLKVLDVKLFGCPAPKKTSTTLGSIFRAWKQYAA